MSSPTSFPSDPCLVSLALWLAMVASFLAFIHSCIPLSLIFSSYPSHSTHRPMARIVAFITHPLSSLRIYSSSSFPSPPPPHPLPSLSPPPLYRNATHHMEKTKRRYLTKLAQVLALLPRPPPSVPPSLPASPPKMRSVVFCCGRQGPGEYLGKCLRRGRGGRGPNFL